jgi:hypothetical protein
MASMDISNMYTNIPTNDLIQIIGKWCGLFNADTFVKQEILKVSNLLKKQNHFKFKDKTYIQKKGLAVGAPTSSILSEIFLQYLENTVIHDILRKADIIGYFRYVDDILILYKADKTNVNNILKQFNNLAPELNFTLEMENQKINFLDLTLTRHHNKLHINIYRKPTTTDAIIPQDFCHPQEHKLVAARYFTNRILTYSIDPVDKQTELSTVKQILLNNKYNVPTIIKSLTKVKIQLVNSENKQNKRWTKFTFIGKETRQITRLFKHTNVKVAFTTSNNLGTLLNHQPPPPPNTQG